MTNQELIKSAHIWFVAVVLAIGLCALVGRAGTAPQDPQNQNQNQNQNSNSNAAGNANRSKNDNANRRANRNTGDTGNTNTNTNTSTTGEQAGMGGLSAQDRDFIMDAAMGGLMEVELGRWAAQKGTSEAVKQFGQRMVADHSQANTELATLATSKGITLPTTLDAKHQQHVSKITRLSGEAFDRAYGKLMSSDHKKDVSEFQKQSTKGADADIKAFAAKTLPTLQEHLQMAMSLPGAQGGSNNSGGSRDANANANSNSSNSNRSSNRNSNGNGNSNRP